MSNYSYRYTYRSTTTYDLGRRTTPSYLPSPCRIGTRYTGCYSLPSRKYLYFVGSDRHTESVNPDVGSDSDEDEESVITRKSLPEVKSVDFRELSNAIKSHTQMYDRVNPSREDGRYLVLRRGENFNFEITLDRPYKKEEVGLSVVFEIGKTPSDGDGSRVVLPLNGKPKSKTWKLDILATVGHTVDISIRVPPTCPIGKWNFKINIMNKDNKRPALKEWNYSKPLYIIFNPWCKDDKVYHPNEKFLEEYVLEDEGGIYVGCYKNGKYYNKRWAFAQFEDPVLDCVMRILEKDKPKLKIGARSDPLQVTRKLTSVVNCCDNNGVLMGNWSGNYNGGTKPTAWNGSLPIMEKYYNTKKPVRFGQCWVFSGVLTTCLRALGIPARSVTNFDSAHDTDCSLTIDKYFYVSPEGPIQEDEARASDSVWNFHVWNDAWMARPDLQGVYKQSGWQACDATPQEASNGIMCCGPCPLQAIKDGRVDVSYDGLFMCAEVNGDFVNWLFDDNKYDYEIHSIGKNKIASAILTSTNGREENVLQEYKYQNETQQRSAVKTAISLLPEGNNKENLLDFYDVNNKPAPEVKLELVDIDTVLYGDTFTVTLRVTNLVNEKRNVTIVLSSKSFYYTGVFHKTVKEETFKDTLQRKERKTFKMTVTFAEYEPATCENCLYKIFMSCKVHETGRTYFDVDDFSLVKPTMVVKAYPTKVKVGEKVKVDVSFVNSLPMNLTQCTLSVEGIDLQRPREIQIPGMVGAHKTFRYELDICPFQKSIRKPRTLIVDFDSKEIVDIKGYCQIEVIE